MIIETFDSKQTYELGYKLGCEAKAGDIYCLDGELGVGKTVFTPVSYTHLTLPTILLV